MKDINNMLKVYKSTFSNKFSKLTQPIKDHFAIDEFLYSSISTDGTYFSISNDPEPSEYYFSNNLFTDSKWIRHPDNYNDEYFISRFPTEDLTKSATVMEEKFGLSGKQRLIIFKKEKRNAHYFLFNIKRNDPSVCAFYMNNIAILDSFCDYILSEWKPYIPKLDNYHIDIAQHIGSKFYDPVNVRYSSETDENKVAFLKSIGMIPTDFIVPPPLSDQEKRCMELMHKGKTILDTAGEMKLSPRTVEYYLENVKNKLNCYTKSETLERYHYLKRLGIC